VQVKSVADQSGPQSRACKQAAVLQAATYGWPSTNSSTGEDSVKAPRFAASRASIQRKRGAIGPPKVQLANFFAGQDHFRTEFGVRAFKVGHFGSFI